MSLLSLALSWLYSGGRWTNAELGSHSIPSLCVSIVRLSLKDAGDCELLPAALPSIHPAKLAKKGQLWNNFHTDASPLQVVQAYKTMPFILRSIRELCTDLQRALTWLLGKQVS